MLFSVPVSLGYPALAGLVLGESAGLPLPGETALITAGGLAAAGHLALGLVVIIAVLAAVAGDTLGFWIGRRRGREVLLRDGFMAAHRRHAVARADRFFARHGVATVFVGRFVPGVRVVAGDSLADLRRVTDGAPTEVRGDGSGRRRVDGDGAGGEFLRHRRAALQPEDVGLVKGPRRRSATTSSAWPATRPRPAHLPSPMNGGNHQTPASVEVSPAHSTQGR